MKNCPVCNELLGDNVEICYRCKHNFRDKVFICSKCGKRLENESSTCECGGWATTPVNNDNHATSLFNWNRADLKSKAKERLGPILFLAVIACLLLSLFSDMQLSTRRPLAYQRYDENDNLVTYQYNSSIRDFVLATGSDIPSELTLRVGWKTFTLILNKSYNYIRGIFLIIFLLRLVFAIFIKNPYEVALNRFFMANIYGKTELKSVLFSFRAGNYLPVLGKMLFMYLKIFLWSLLLVIPGIVKGYEYMMVPYLLSENPGMSTDQAFRISREMMTGNKWNVFVLDLSFILWDILSIFTFGIVGVVWVYPYRQATRAELYDFFRRCYIGNGSDYAVVLKGYEG